MLLAGEMKVFEYESLDMCTSSKVQKHIEIDVYLNFQLNIIKWLVCTMLITVFYCLY